MAKASNYTSKTPDENGVIHWSDEENKMWSELVARQLACIEGKACDEYIKRHHPDLRQTRVMCRFEELGWKLF